MTYNSGCVTCNHGYNTVTSDASAQYTKYIYMKEFIVGGASAMTASSITHPIDLVKVRMLLYGELQKNTYSRLSIFKNIFKKEGIRGMYNGVSAALFRQSLFSTSRFGIYDIIKKCSLSEKEEYELMIYVRQKGMTFISTPFSREAADRLKKWEALEFLDLMSSKNKEGEAWTKFHMV